MSLPDHIGKTIGNYRIEANLGTGGMGQVYRARHLHLDWVAAVKVLHAHLAADDMFRSRFLQEARAVAMLEHRNIVRLFDFGQHDGQLYLVMELLTDGSLRTLLRDRAEPNSSWSQAVGLDLVRQAADGLAYAHERNMVHRDIKPDNLLLEAVQDGERRYTGKLADFGLARLGDGGGMTASGVTLGTPAYMSPEQCQGVHVDGRGDIYSLGIVLYEVVTGRLPFSLRSLSDAIYNHVYVAPPPPRLLMPSLSGELEAVILRCLAKRPDERFQTVTEFAASLDAAVAALPAARPSANSIAPERAAPVQIDAPLSTAIEAEPESPPPLMTPATGPTGAQIPRIYVIDADGAVVEMASLTGAGLTVGRLSDNQLVLNVDGVSRHHLMIDWDGARAHITDIGSSHGTSLGGTPVPAHVSRDWDPRDAVRIGGLQLRLVVPSPEATSQRRHDPLAVTDPARPTPVAEWFDRRRWPLLAAAGVAVVGLAVLASFLFTGGGDGDGAGSATSTSASTSGIAIVGDLTATSSIETAVQSTTAAQPSTATGTVDAERATAVVPTVPPTPATGAEWIAETVADPAVGPLLGQPLADPVAVRTPYQLFERGVMISLVDVHEDGGTLVAVANIDNPDAGNCTYYDTVDLDSVPLETPEPGPPAGLYLPSEPFAAIWQAVPGLRDEIGWATFEEPDDGVVYQSFERGFVVFLADTYRTWVYYGELTLDSSNAWRAFWNQVEEPDASALVGLQQIARVSALEEVSGQLGAAVTDAAPVEIPYQLFEHGMMMTSDFLALDDPAAAGYVITLVAEGGDDSGSWRSDQLVTVMLDPNTTPLGTPPAGLYLPGYPFDIILQHDPELASALGWATWPSLDSEAAWQGFERGLIIWFADTYRCWVIQSGNDAQTGAWRSYWDE